METLPLGINTTNKLPNTRSKKPAMYDLNMALQAGFDPRTKLPTRMLESSVLKDHIKKSIKVLDELDAVRRFNWYNLPDGMTSELLEQMLYYKGQVAMFYVQELDKFYILPYTLAGEDSLDCYGRYKQITPISYNGVISEDGNKKPKLFLPGLVKNVIYDPLDTEYYESAMDGAVILKDYSAGISQTKTPRVALQEGVIDAMAEAFPMARTSLLANSGIKLFRVNDDDQAATVESASDSVLNAALTGKPFLAAVGQVEIQDLTSAGSALKSEEYLVYMQALDNYRLSMYGLKNGGLFQKKTHMLESEQQMNNASTQLALDDGLKLRQDFCLLANLNWGLNIWCEVSEAALGFDTNGDGIAYDSEAYNQQEETQEQEGDSNVE